MGEINDNEIRVIGGDSAVKRSRRFPWWILVVVAVVAVVVVLVVMLSTKKSQPVEEFMSMENMADAVVADDNVWFDNTDASLPAATLIADTIVDSIHLRILTPYNAVPELHVGQLSRQDTTVVLAAMAADLRRDNGGIVGAFVLEGKPLSWGLSKRGYCAIINDRITIGVASNTSLFEQATEQGGYFFRQYPSVHNGAMVRNNPENASFRRALCIYDGKVCVITCTDRVVMDDFSRALESLGVSEAILLVGGTAECWCRNADGNLEVISTSIAKKTRQTNYIVFRKQ